MPLIVQKFGGSSVGTADRMALVAERIAQRCGEGQQIVAVVSAMQGETDRLLSLAKEVSGGTPSPREVDQLLSTGEQVSAALVAMALQKRGIAARSFTGAQMRLYTDGTFEKARLKKMDDRAIRAALARGEVVVATGFQGIDEEGNATTLGRGGSDTSAVALAATLGAQVCEIYTDVRGVFTADPRVCQSAECLSAITADEMLEMASLGAKVLQIRSVEVAMNHGVDIRVRSTFEADEGTLVAAREAPIERVNVVGVTHTRDEAKVTLSGLPAAHGAARVFSTLAKANVNVDVIVQTTPHEKTVDLSFTLARTDLSRAERVIEDNQSHFGMKSVQASDDVGKVSIVGVGMMSHPGVAARMFEVLGECGIGIELISTSEIKVTTVIARTRVDDAVRALHAAFELG